MPDGTPHDTGPPGAASGPAPRGAASGVRGKGSALRAEPVAEAAPEPGAATTGGRSGGIPEGAASGPARTSASGPVKTSASGSARTSASGPARTSASGPTLIVCTTCRIPPGDRVGPGTAAPQDMPRDQNTPRDPDAPRDGARLLAALAALGLPVRGQECLAACARGCAVAFTGSGRWTFVQGGLDPDRDLAALAVMAARHAEAPGGLVPWRERPEVIRRNIIARLPPEPPDAA